MVLLVVDAQKAITNEKLYQFEKFTANVKLLIKTARKNKIEVIYVRHDDGPGCELTKGQEGFEIYDEFRPINGEQIFDKNVNSAFKGTGLLEYLKNKEESDIIVVGLQTDYCIDATIKCGFEHGFRMMVPEYANTTVDNVFIDGETSYTYYNTFMWNGRYADCISIEKALDMMQYSCKLNENT